MTDPTKSPAVSEREARSTIRDALLDSQYLAGLKAGWNAAQADDPEKVFAGMLRSRDGHLAGYADAKEILARLAPAPEKVVREAWDRDAGIALKEATDLAWAMFNQYYSFDEEYASGRIKWSPLPDILGVISQIDNMATGLERKKAALAQPEAATGWEDEDRLADMAAFGASESACILYPGADQQAERTAYCKGAGDGVSAICRRQEDAQPEAARVGGDWVLVPREPTQAMLDAGRNAANDKRWAYCGHGPREEGTGLDGMEFYVRDAYRAMLAALAQPEAARVDPDAATGCGDDLGLFAQPNMDEQPEAARVGGDWECFCDVAYFDMWCVRRVGSKTFGDGFHVMSEVEARALLAALATQQAAGSEGSPAPHVFLDCDGVLADFDTYAEAYFGMPPRQYEKQVGSNQFWKELEAKGDFYRNLPLMPDAMALVDGVRHLKPTILTGCPRGNWAEAQKIAWAHEHFPDIPVITCRSADKRLHAKPGDVLIDDWPQHRHRWIEMGGVFISHFDAESSLASLWAHYPALRAPGGEGG